MLFPLPPARAAGVQLPKLRWYPSAVLPFQRPRFSLLPSRLQPHKIRGSRDLKYGRNFSPNNRRGHSAPPRLSLIETAPGVHPAKTGDAAPNARRGAGGSQPTSPSCRIYSASDHPLSEPGQHKDDQDRNPKRRVVRPRPPAQADAIFFPSELSRTVRAPRSSRLDMNQRDQE